MNLNAKIQQFIDGKLDNVKIGQKLRLIYIVCVIIPLVLTDGVIIGTVFKAESASRQHELERTANAVHSDLCNEVENAQKLAKTIYTSKMIDAFLRTEFASNLDYFTQYNSFFQETLLDIGTGQNNMKVVFYVDNDTIVSGSEFQKIEKAKNATWYQYMKSQDLKKGLCFAYEEIAGSSVGKERKIYFFQKLDFYGETDSVLLVELNYANFVRNLHVLNDAATVLVCDDENVYISNGKNSSVSKEFGKVSEIGRVSYQDSFTLYGEDLNVYVIMEDHILFRMILSYLPLLILLVFANILVPFFVMDNINRSFTARIEEVTDAMSHVEEENLAPIQSPRGTDEIGNLMRDYNRMVERTNSLIHIVYKNKIREQEMLVARQNAELLALHSQVNPHFLFNALESIRMHSLIKRETETADMVEKLAKMQRQYVQWQDDIVTVEKEMELVSAYLGLQKYRFGDRLSYELDVEEGCQNYYIPALSIVTFVENACVHGIESKTVPGWIFVRISTEDGMFCLEIEDTGNGMEEEQANSMKKRMYDASISMLKEKGRVGTVNAALRLKMFSKETVQFDLESEVGIGTIISFRVPLEYVKGMK